MNDMKYLRQRVKGGVFQVQFRVPKNLTHLSEGKTVITRSTGTSSLREAKAFRDAFLVEWEGIKLKASINPKGQRLRSLVKQLKKSYDEAQGDYDTAQHWFDAHDAEYYHDQGDKIMTDAIMIASGGEGKFSGVSLIPTISELALEFAEEIKEQKSTSYYNKVKRAGTRWLEFIKDDVPINEIGRAMVKKFIKHLKPKLAGKTVADTLSILNKVWRYAADEEHVNTESPFIEHDISTAPEDPYVSLELTEWKNIVRNWNGMCKTEGALLFPFLGIASGMRIEELAGLKKSDIVQVKGVYCFDVNIKHRTLKNKSATRLIPIIDRYVPYVLKMAEGNPEDCLFIEAQNAPTKRSSMFSDMFTDAKRQAGIKVRSKAFHSLRKNFSTALEDAEVDERIASKIAGHTHAKSMTFGLYSDGASVAKILKPAMDKVEKELDEFLVLDGL
ncbi:site-specific integrase [Pleionea sp. CnH1-48]|uniref:site-specific integrase n=1 Tax=Pleionea sp. CnH1-48 TaxID=2954494 RepID=UPI0020979B2B|nr:site-specific integrase [Pleionea sp. CnH1-48]MCO7227511.1 site-specific integrase [Pleionea sp. CnH1-48]